MMKYYLKTIKALLAGLIVAVAAGSAQAADYYWDQNGTDPGFGNGGTWGTDAFWTTDSSGGFSDGGTDTTTSDDVAHINQENISSFAMDVSGIVEASRMVIPSTASPFAAINGTGSTIHVHTSGLGDANAVVSTGGDQKFVMDPNLVLEAVGGSTVTLGTSGGNNANATYNGSIVSTNTVDLLFGRPGALTLNGDIDLQGGAFLSESGGSFRPKLHTVSGALGTGVHHVQRSGPLGGHSNDKGRLVLANSGNAYTGDTILDTSIIRLTTASSLPDTTKIYITNDGTFELNFTGTDTIAGLYFEGLEQAGGKWGRVGSIIALGADNESALFTGDGLLEVVSSGGPTFVLTIDQDGANLDLTWNSQAGKVYDLISSTDLSIPRASWPVWDSNENIPASGSGTNLLTIPLPPSDPTRFFAVLEKDPLPFYEEDFEADDGGYTLKVAGATGSSWEHGDPDSTSPGGDVLTGNGGSTNCWGTNLGLADAGEYIVPTETCLRSPVIDLTGVTGAELTFAETLDLQDDDTAVVNIINATTDDVILAAVYTADDSGEVSLAAWKDVPAIDITAAVGQMVRIEWCLSGTTPEYLGWYIDDVKVTETAPE